MGHCPVTPQGPVPPARMQGIQHKPGKDWLQVGNSAGSDLHTACVPVTAKGNHLVHRQQFGVTHNDCSVISMPVVPDTTMCSAASFDAGMCLAVVVPVCREDEVPQLQDVSDMLKEATGWQVRGWFLWRIHPAECRVNRIPVARATAPQEQQQQQLCPACTAVAVSKPSLACTSSPCNA